MSTTCAIKLSTPGTEIFTQSMEHSDRKITDEELKVFHTRDRCIYARVLLSHDPPVSKKIVAFWYHLDTIFKFGFMVNILASVDPAFFRGLVAESITFLEFLYSGQVTSAFVFPRLSHLLLGDSLLVAVFMNKEKSKEKIESHEKSFERAFSDIEPIKTLFLTFSRGHPILEQELRVFFLLNFGDCVEAIYMAATNPNTQPLFARVQCKSAADVRNILSDQSDKTFSIHGKDVRIRRFTEKKTSNKNQQNRNGQERIARPNFDNLGKNY